MEEMAASAAFFRNPAPVQDFYNMRRYIVCFDEAPSSMELIKKTLVDSDVLVSIAASGVLHPAAFFVQMAKHHEARTIAALCEGYLCCSGLIHGCDRQL